MLRDWQKSARRMINEISKQEAHALIAVNACVGSGKTTVAMQAMVDFIEKNVLNETIQVFVCPRLALCKQQAAEIEDYFTKSQIESFKVICYNCEGEKPKEFVDHNQHIVLVACDKSIWDDKLPSFKRLLESRKCGVIAYDEAHNYSAHCSQMFHYTEDESLPYTADDGLAAYFETNLFMSGTPNEYQIKLSKDNHSIDLSIKDAISITPRPYICKPTLNLVHSKEEVFDVRLIRNAIIAVKNHEKEFYENNKYMQPRILVCADGIDTIQNIKNELGDDCHVILLHSVKETNINNAPDFFEPEINGDKKSKAEVMEMLDAIDSGSEKASELLSDKKPIIVLQVDMISEGVNIKSFNSVFITSHSETKQMQQIGRVLRHFVVEDENKKVLFDKYQSGLANIYCPISNDSEIGELLFNLERAGLSEGCFNWGKIVNVTHSSANTELSDNPAKPEIWKSIDSKFNIDELYKMGDSVWNSKVLSNVLNLNLSDELKSKLVNLAKALTEGKLSKGKTGSKSKKGTKKGKSEAESKSEKKRESDITSYRSALRSLYKKLLLNGITETLKPLYFKNEILFYNQFLHDAELSEFVKDVFDKIGLRMR
jgi:hypothetical protein